MWTYKMKKCNFYVFWSVSNDLKTCPYVEFCSIFWLQALLKTFLWVKSIHTRYLKGPPGSGLYNGNKIMVIQRINHFYWRKRLYPLNTGFGNRFFGCETCFWELFDASHFLHWIQSFACLNLLGKSLWLKI